MNFMKKMLLVLLGACLLCGCTKSNIVTPEAGNDEDLPMPDANGIVWEQVWDEFDPTYADLDIYPFAETVNAGVYPDINEVRFFLLLNTVISDEDAAAYAEEVIKGFNDLIAEQNSAYAFSSDESYGGYVSQFDIHVMVSPDDGKEDKANWILEDTIPAGEYRPVDPTARPEIK